MPQNFSKKLSELKMPHIKSGEHKRKLKNAVLNTAYLNNKSKFLRGLNLFAYLRTMSLKKLIPAGMMAIILLTIVGQNFIAWRNTAYAQELITDTIKKIEAQPLTEEERETMSTIQILEEMKKEGELKYLGESPYPPATENGSERKMQKFSFTDPNLSNDLILNVLDKKEVIFMIDAPNQQNMYRNFKVKINNKDEIENLSELKTELKDPNLKNDWILEFIKKSNERNLEMQRRHLNELYLSNEYFEGLNLSQMEKEKRIETEKKCNAKSEKIFNQIEPLIKEAQVIINGVGGGCGPEESDFLYSISIFPITGQKNKTTEAQSEIKKIIEKLNEFKTKTAQMKVEALEKGIKSKNLRSYPDTDNTFFSFPYIGAGDDEELNIWIDPEDKTENFLHLNFTSEALSIIPGEKGEWIDVKIKNGEISNFQELKNKFKDPNLKDELLRHVINNQNIELGKNIEEYELGDSKKLTPKIVDQLQELFADSEVPILERALAPAKFQTSLTIDPSESQDDPNVLYSLGIYPFGHENASENSNAQKLLDEIIKKLKSTVNSENQSTIEILKHALEADELKYEGEEKLGEEIIKNLSFKDGDILNNIKLSIWPSGKVQFILDPILDDGVTNSFPLKVDKNGKIENIEQLKNKLNDPNLTKLWLKKILQINNLEWIKEMENLSEMNENEELKEKEKIILSQLEDMNQKASVIIGSLRTQNDQLGEVSYAIDLYSITGQKANKERAETRVKKMIEELSKFNTKVAQTKIKILKEALSSDKLEEMDLAYYKEPLLRFTYHLKGEEKELYLIEDNNDSTENFVYLTFNPPFFIGRQEEIVLKVENGLITNLSEVLATLKKNPTKDPMEQFIIKNQNQHILKGFKNTASMSSMFHPPIIQPKMIPQLEELLKNSQEPIYDLSKTDDNVVLLLSQ